MFLRPTESKVIFEQQYGRGLRIASKKEKVIVLDFIGNHRTADFIKSYFKIEDISSGSTKFEESPIDEKMVYYYDNNVNEIHFEKDAIKNIEVEGESGGSLVKVVLTGDYEIKAIKVSDEAKKETNEIIYDLIIAAYNNAKEKLKKKSSEELLKATGGMNLPFDIKFPL